MPYLCGLWCFANAYNYNSVRGIGGTQVIYTSTVYKDDRIKLYGYNPSSNGGVTVTVSGYWNP